MFKKTAFVLMAMAGVALSTGSAAAATEVARYGFSGAQASAVFTATTSITCPGDVGGFAMVIGSLQGSEQISSSSDSPPYIANGVYVQLQGYYNSCTGISAAGFGGVSGGFTPPTNKLTSAHMAGSGSVQNYSTGARIAVSFDVEIVGVGGISTSKSNSQSRTMGTKTGPLTINHDHSANTNRSGEASGTVTVDGITFPTIESYYSGLNTNSTATISVWK